MSPYEATSGRLPSGQAKGPDRVAVVPKVSHRGPWATPVDRPGPLRGGRTAAALLVSLAVGWGGLPAQKAHAQASASAVPAQAVSQERAALAEHRRLLLKALADEEAACRERFAVTACQDDVRRRRREALGPLRERELRLEEAERRARAEERRRLVAARQAAAAERAIAASAARGSAIASSPVPEQRVRRPLGAASGARAAGSTPADGAALRARQGPGRGASEAAASLTARETEAAERVQEAERRRERAEATRARIERRQAEREAAGRRSEPLPPPGAASQPR